MLSHRLQQHFAALGARLIVRTDPKGTLLRLALKQDAHGDLFELTLPRLSRRLVNVIAVQPRRQRLVLRMGAGPRQPYVLVQLGALRQIRALRATEARSLLVAPRAAGLSAAA